jgi:hypothetical protein
MYTVLGVIRGGGGWEGGGGYLVAEAGEELS